MGGHQRREQQPEAFAPTWATSGSVYVAQGMSNLLNAPRPKNRAFRITMRAMKSATCVNLNWESVDLKYAAKVRTPEHDRAARHYARAACLGANVPDCKDSRVRRAERVVDVHPALKIEPNASILQPQILDVRDSAWQAVRGRASGAARSAYLRRATAHRLRVRRGAVPARCQRRR